MRAVWALMITSNLVMATKDTERGIVVAELRTVGIKPMSVEATGRGHFRIAWRATPDREAREIFVAATPGDWRDARRRPTTQRLLA